jgi:hypothetical protein
MPRNVVTAFASATSGAVLTALAISCLQQEAWVELVEEVAVRHLSTLDLKRAAKDKRVATERRREAADEYAKRDKHIYDYFSRPRSRSRA